MIYQIIYSYSTESLQTLEDEMNRLAQQGWTVKLFQISHFGRLDFMMGWALMERVEGNIVNFKDARELEGP